LAAVVVIGRGGAKVQGGGETQTAALQEATPTLP